MTTPRGWGDPARPPNSGNQGQPATPNPTPDEGSPRSADAAGTDPGPLSSPSFQAPQAPQASPFPQASPSTHHPAGVLGLGDLMEGAIAAIRSAPRVTWTFGAIVVATLGVLEVVLARLVGLDGVLDRLVDIGAWPQDAQVEARLVTGQILSSALAGLVGAVGATVVAAFTARSMALSAEGVTPTVARVWAAVRPRLGGLVVLALIAVVTTLGVLVLPGLALGLLGSAIGPGSAVLGALVGLVVGVVLAFFAVPPVVVAVPAYSVSTSGVAGALRRARGLVRGHRWPLVGIWLLSVIVLGIASAAISAPFSWVGAMVAPQDVSGYGVAGSIVASAVTAPIGALVLALVHADLVRVGNGRGRSSGRGV